VQLEPEEICALGCVASQVILRYIGRIAVYTDGAKKRVENYNISWKDLNIDREPRAT
jgi:hypothetical protein